MIPHDEQVCSRRAALTGRIVKEDFSGSGFDDRYRATPRADIWIPRRVGSVCREKRLTRSQPATLHAEYGGDLALIDIRTLAVFSGRLPPRVTGLVIEWATLHQQELLADWDRARAREELQKIAPLE